MCRTSSRLHQPKGFTLMESLVAMIVVALTISVFFQLLSASMKLELRGRERTGQILLVDRTFMDLQRRDIRDADFPWDGEAGGLAWELRVHPVDTTDMRTDVENLPLRLSSELFLFAFHYSLNGVPHGEIHRYATFPPDFFDDQFRSKFLTPFPR